MIASAFLQNLRRRNIRVWAEGDKLRCSAPPGVLTPSLRDQLRQEKSAILEFLRGADALARQERAIVPMQPRGQRIPVFAVPGHNGNVFSFRFLARQLGEEQPFFGLQPPGVEGECEPLARVEELATYFAERILAFRPGPYAIAGHCAGGGTAFELARQLQQRGAEVTFLALFGSPYPAWFRRGPQVREHLAHQAEWLRHHLHALGSLSNRERCRYITAKMTERWHQGRLGQKSLDDSEQEPVLMQRAKIEAATRRALRRYRPRRFTGRVALFLPNREWCRRGQALRWRDVAADCELHFGPPGCEGDVMLHEPHVRVIAEQLQACARRAETKAGEASVRSSPAGGFRIQSNLQSA